MNEMLLVGRGGEGVVVASQLLADAFARAGFFVQSFPEFKAERRGAPISAFLRWDLAPIHRRYKLTACDVLVAVSPSPPPEAALRAVRPGGLVVVNRQARWARSGPFTVARVDATAIAREQRILSVEGRPLGNVAVAAACVRLLLPGGLGYLEDAVRDRLGALAPPNLVAAREGYARCTRQRTRAGDVPVEAVAVPAPAPLPRFPVSTTDSLGVVTGTWSVERPVLADACTACAVCALFCPEGAISRTGGVMAIDLLHCKGCGICAAVCPVRGAIALEEVPA